MPSTSYRRLFAVARRLALEKPSLYPYPKGRVGRVVEWVGGTLYLPSDTAFEPGYGDKNSIKKD